MQPLCTQSDREYHSEVSKIDRWLADPEADRVVKRRREIQYCYGPGSKGNRAPVRDAITSFSAVAAKRLRRYIDNYYTDFKNMITLTYGEIFPTDGREVKSHLRAFWERLRRHEPLDARLQHTSWMAAHSAVWWIEYQERGAPHIHILTTGWLEKTWIAKAWSDITGGDLYACSRVEALRSPDSAGSYAAKYAAKEEQHTVPQGFTNCGRHWGRVGARPADGSSALPRVAAATRAASASVVRASAGAHMRAREVARARGYKSGVKLPMIVIKHPTMGIMALHTIRVYEHDGGYSIYGSESDIAIYWDYMQHQMQMRNVKHE